MPVPNDRHAKLKGWEWGSNPARGQQRAAARNDDPARKQAPSKVKKGVCKGPDGWHPSHRYVARRAVNEHTGHDFAKPCGWAPEGEWKGREEGYTYGPAWTCYHERVCECCGTVETPYFLMGQQCPEFAGQPVPPEVEALCRERQDAYDEFRSRQRRSVVSKPQVTGKQSYRKKKKKEGG